MKRYVVMILLLGWYGALYAQQIGNGIATPLSTFNTATTPSGMYVGTPTITSRLPNAGTRIQQIMINHAVNDTANFQLQLGATANGDGHLYFRSFHTIIVPEAENVTATLISPPRRNPYPWIALATCTSNTFSGSQIFNNAVTFNDNIEFPLGGYWNADGKVYIHSNTEHPNIAGWRATYLQWVGHSLIMGSPKGHYFNNRVELKPGGYEGEELPSELEMYKSLPNLTHDLRVKLHTNGPSFFTGGNVGIGTKSPQYELDVYGTIRAREILVDLNGIGADFVFDVNYLLPSLQEVESFIHENRHLPNIPSAQQMNANGVNVNDLQIQLLQKIEELTLYVIEQDKKIHELQEQLDGLRK